MLRLNVEDDYPALPCQIARPIVVGYDDLVVLRHAARRDKCAAISRRGQLRILGRLILLVQPGQIVVRHFLKRVESHDVPYVQIDAVRLHAIGNAL